MNRILLLPCERGQVQETVISTSVQHAVNTVIHRFRRLNPQNLRTIVGLSGGADSVALLKCLSLASKDVLAVHVIHDIRPIEESHYDLKVARDAARVCGVDFLSLRIFPQKEAVARGENLESCARRLRYNALSNAAHTRLESAEGKSFIRKDSIYYNERNLKAVIATAHHADDQLETLLMRLCRGSGLSGMSGIASCIAANHQCSHAIIRPMLDISRADTEAICAEYNLVYATDASNFDETLTRNKIRHQVVPVLKSLYSKAAEHSSELAKILASAQKVVERQSCTCFGGDHDSSPGNWTSTSSDWLRLQEDVVIYEWITYAIRSVCNGGGVNYDKINNQMVDDVVQAIRKRKTKTYYWPSRVIEVGIEQVKIRKMYQAEIDKQENESKEKVS